MFFGCSGGYHINEPMIQNIVSYEIFFRELPHFSATEKPYNPSILFALNISALRAHLVGADIASTTRHATTLWLMLPGIAGFTCHLCAKRLRGPWRTWSANEGDAFVVLILFLGYRNVTATMSPSLTGLWQVQSLELGVGIITPVIRPKQMMIFSSSTSH